VSPSSLDSLTHPPAILSRALWYQIEFDFFLNGLSGRYIFFTTESLSQNILHAPSIRTPVILNLYRRPSINSISILNATISLPKFAFRLYLSFRVPQNRCSVHNIITRVRSHSLLTTSIVGIAETINRNMARLDLLGHPLVSSLPHPGKTRTNHIRKIFTHQQLWEHYDQFVTSMSKSFRTLDIQKHSQTSSVNSGSKPIPPTQEIQQLNDPNDLAHKFVIELQSIIDSSFVFFRLASVFDLVPACTHSPMEPLLSLAIANRLSSIRVRLPI